jgi:hypothetical protein
MLTLQELQIAFHFNIYLVISKRMQLLFYKAFSRHYLLNSLTSDIHLGMFDYVDVV